MINNNSAKYSVVFTLLVVMIVLITGFVAAASKVGRGGESTSVANVSPYLYLQRISPPITQKLIKGDKLVVGLRSVTPQIDLGANPYVSEAKLKFNALVLSGSDITVPDDELSLLEQIDNTLGTASIDLAKIGPGKYIGDRILAQFEFVVLDDTVATATISIDPATTLGSPNVYVANAQYTNLVISLLPQVCGDNLVSGTEICDGGSISCKLKGGKMGSRTCNSTCTGYNTCR